jgi:hypothetical protein
MSILVIIIELYQRIREGQQCSHTIPPIAIMNIPIRVGMSSYRVMPIDNVSIISNLVMIIAARSIVATYCYTQ